MTSDAVMMPLVAVMTLPKLIQFVGLKSGLYCN